MACLPPAATRLRSRPSSKVTNKLIDETAWIRERKEVAARELVDVLVKSFPRDAPLEVDRKEPIIAAGDNMDRILGPRFETAGLAEHNVGLGALVSLALLDDLGRNVVQEVRGEVEVRAIAATLCSLCSRSYRSGVAPPFPSRLAGNRNHGVDEYQACVREPASTPAAQ